MTIIQNFSNGGDVSIQSIRALENHALSRGPEPFRDFLLEITTALKNGSIVELNVIEGETK